MLRIGETADSGSVAVMFNRIIRARAVARTSLLVGLAGAAAGVVAQTAPIVQPGAPGQPTRPLAPEEASRIAETRYSPDDVHFMQQMIVHHQQALAMAELVSGRTNRQPVID